MQKIQYIRNNEGAKVGDVDMVSNNVAHGLINRGVAVLYRNKIFRSPIDKMMKTEETVEETKSERRARQKKESSEKKGYQTK